MIIVIRLAKKEDMNQLLPLVMIILKDMELPLLQKKSEDEIEQLLLEASQDDTYRYSFTRALVIENEGIIEGVAFSYDSQDEAIIDDAWNRLSTIQEPLFVDKETLGNEWYLDSLAVRSSSRGQGYGTQLISAVCQLAKQNGAQCVGLNVDIHNPKAASLYHRLGFEKMGEVNLSSHRYDHLQKEI